MYYLVNHAGQIVTDSHSLAHLTDLIEELQGNYDIIDEDGNIIITDWDDEANSPNEPYTPPLDFITDLEFEEIYENNENSSMKTY